jgi:hypothetical protein
VCGKKFFYADQKAGMENIKEEIKEIPITRFGIQI